MIEESDDRSPAPGGSEDDDRQPLDELLPYKILVRPASTVRPIVLDLLRVLKRHRLIFGFYSRLALTMPDQTVVPCQRYFQYNWSLSPQDLDAVDADQLFTCQHNIEDHLRRNDELGRNDSSSYFECTWQGGQVLEASACDVERVHAALVVNRTDDWPQRPAVAAAARLVRPGFLVGGSWTFTSKISFQYPKQLAEQLSRLAGFALSEGEDRGFQRQLEGVEVVVPQNPAVSPTDGTPLAAAGPVVQREQQIVPSSDYRTVFWGTTRFEFTPLQAEVIKLLHAQYEKRPGLGLSEATIVEAVRSDAERPRVDHMFRMKGNKMHEAWKTMIVRPSKGTLCLAVPNHQ